MRVLKYLYLLALFFPFVTPIKLGFDSQPWALLIGVFVLLLKILDNKVVIPKVVIGFFLTIGYGILSIIVNLIIYKEIDIFVAFRSLFTVVSLPLCFIAFYNCNFRLSEIVRFFKFSVITYFVVGAIQLLVSPGFLTFLIARASTTDTRGVFSLAPEPVEYSRMCIFFFIMLCQFRMTELISNRTFVSFALLLFIQCILFSLSGTGFVWLLALTVIYFFNSGFNKVRLVLGVGVFLAALFIIVKVGMEYFPEKRVFYLISVAIDNPQLLTSFAGFFLRLLNPIHSFYVGIIEFYGMGVGFGYTVSGASIDYSFLGPFFKDVSIEISARSHGGLVSILYELGVFCIPFVISFIAITGFRNFTKHKLSYSFVFFSFLLVTVFDGPIANPILALMLGTFYLTKKNIQQNLIKH